MLSMTPENSDARLLRWAMVWKFSAMSALPLTRPDALTPETKPSITAPRYCAGLLTVSEKRSRSCVVFVLRSSSSVATSRVPAGTMKPAAEVLLDPVPTAARIHVPLRLLRRSSIEARNRHRLTASIVNDAAGHAQVGARVHRLEGDREVTSVAAGGREHQLIAMKGGAGVDVRAGRLPAPFERGRRPRTSPGARVTSPC